MSRGALTKPELHAYRKQLLDLEARLTGKVTRLEAEALRPGPEAGTNPDERPAHEADPPARAAEEAVAITLLGSEELVLGETREALSRLDAGTFGVCGGCGHAISRARLDAVPYARQCIRCERGATGGDEG